VTVPEVPSVPVSDVPADLDETVLLDVREDDEWETGHVDGALHIPLGELMARVEEVPTDTEVVVTCRGGGRSSRAVAWLNENGYEAVNLSGGVQAWLAAGRPLVDGTGGAGTVR
jgi:rhodanese-related sulfurtransferase